MVLVDTHTHLESFARRGELPGILDRARAAGLGAMITIGTDTDDWTLYRELAREHAGFIHYSAGLHPCSVGEDWAARVAQLETFWGRVGTPLPAAPYPVALGECGLDRFHLPKDAAEAAKIFDWQKGAFAEQLRLAKS